MTNKNYNKYFKSNEERQNTKEIKEITNDKNTSGTSPETPLNIQVEIDKLADNTAIIDPQSEPKSGVISPYKVNMREAATKNSQILCVLDPGTNVIVESIDGDWVHIYIPQGIKGYVMKEYIIISQL